jgi:hypothetical protein
MSFQLRVFVGATLLAAVSAVAHAQPGLDLGVAASQVIYYPGDELRLSVSATNGAGGVGTADFYTGVILPDGVTIATVGPSGAARLGTITQPAAFLPVATGVPLGGAFAASVDPLFNYAWTGSEPLGAYQIFMVAVRAGGFADNRIDGGDILAVQFGGLHLRQPATIAVEASRTATATITEAGGAVSATGSSGAGYTLTVPAGGLIGDQAISVTPLASEPGLPLARLVGGVRFGPDGLQLAQAATLSVTVPPGLPLTRLVGFTANDDGTGFEIVPVTIVGRTVSLAVSHFSSGGIGQSVCGPSVTSAVGIAACRTMAQNLSEAATIIADLESFPTPVRVLLAAEINAGLRGWINQFILPSIRDAANANNPDPTLHYFLGVALREKTAIDAMLQMTEMLDPASGLEAELQAINDALPAALEGRRLAANASCLADRANFPVHVARVREVVLWKETLGYPIVAANRGLSCIQIFVNITYPDVVPDAGAEFVATAEPKFSDGQPLVNGVRPLVMLEVADRGADIAPPAFAQEFGRVTLRTHIRPRVGVALGPQFDLRASVNDLALTRVISVSRPHRITLLSQQVEARKQLRAGSQTSGVTITRAGDARVFAQELSSLPDDTNPGTATVAESGLVLTFNTNRTLITGSGQLGNSAAGDADSRVFLETRAAVRLAGGNFQCRFDITTTEFSISATPTFVATVRRNGVVAFQTNATRTVDQVCGEGDYTLEVDASSQVTLPNPSPGSGSRTYAFTITLAPVP